MNMNNFNPFPIAIDYKDEVHSKYITSISNIIPYDSTEKNIQEEILAWINNTTLLTKKGNSEQHLGVVAFITNPEMNKVFLLNHKKAQAYLMPWWHVDQWQTLQEAIENELLEELGLNINMRESEPFYIAKILTEGKNAGHYDVTTVFKVIVDPSIAFSIEEKEADWARWFDWSELDSMPEFTQLSRIKQKLSVKKCILLDNGGVLSEHYCQPYHQQLSNLIGVNETVLRSLLSEKSPHWKAYRKNLISRDDFWGTVLFLAKSKSNINYSQLERLWAESYIINSTIVDILQRYRNIGIKVWLISNSDQYRKKYIEETLQCSNFLDFCIFSCDIGSIKPEKQIFEQISKYIDISHKDIIYVDDREEHMDTAIEMGMQWLIFSTIEHFNASLKQFYRDNR